MTRKYGELSLAKANDKIVTGGLSFMLIKKILPIFTLCCLSLTPLFCHANERLAVMDLNVKHGVEESLANGLSVLIRDKIHSFGKYDVLSREDVGTIAKRTQLQQQIGVDETQRLLSFGKAIGTRYMVAGAISKFGDTFSISLRMLDTDGDNPGVIKREGEKCRCDENLLIETAERVAAKLMGEEVPEVKSSTATSGSMRISSENKSLAASEKPASDKSSKVTFPAKEIGREGQFVAFDNGTILDSKTNLLWAAMDNNANIGWDGAVTYCENFKTGGYDDWRMPEQSELQALYTAGVRKNGHLLKVTGCCVWASESAGSSAASYHFERGANARYRKNDSRGSRALPVRSAE